MSSRIIKPTLLLLALISVTYAWPLKVVSGSKIAYLIMGALLVAFTAFSAEKKASFWLCGYVTAVGGVGLLQLWLLGPSNYFFLSMVPYLVIPIICGRNTLTPEQFDRLLLALSFVAFPNLIGLIAQQYGYNSTFLVNEYTMTASEVHVRYTSIVGGALALGMISTITALSSAYWLLARHQYRIYNTLIFIASTICTYFSYSRRSYVILTLGLLVILWRTHYSPSITRGMLLAMLFALGTVFLAVVFHADVGNAFPRIWSIFDFRNDPGNVLRVIKWIEAIDIISTHPILGIGFGESGTLGRDPSELLNSKDIFSAESYYLQVAMEGGILIGAIILLVIGKVVLGSLKYVQHDQRILLTTTILVIVAIESIAGTAITSPLIGILFWLAYGINMAIIGQDTRHVNKQKHP